MRELFLRVANDKGFWGNFLPLDIMMSTSMHFKLFKRGTAEFFGGDLGIAYRGSQGDVWDAHEDLFLASCGAALIMIIILAINAYGKSAINLELSTDQSPNNKKSY